jgi:hypothetical protein
MPPMPYGLWNDDMLSVITEAVAPMAVAAAETPAPQSLVSIDVAARLREI